MNLQTQHFMDRLKKRLIPLTDMTAWVLVLISVIPLLLIDSSMVLTLVQWTAFGLALAGVSVVISRMVLPQVDLTEWVGRAREGNMAAGLVVLGVALFVGLIIVALILWAKA